jgi:Holliday junction resolvase-like predicted endonuclease
VSIEKELIINVLKWTRNEPISVAIVSKEAKIPRETVENLLEKFQNHGLVYLQSGMIEANNLERLKLAVHALQLGADVERVSNYLQWQEFEQIAVVAFERNYYHVSKNVRFTYQGRKWEIDVVACKKPLVVCVDCKHWHKSLYPSATRKIVEDQVQRTSALAEALPHISEKIGCGSWTTTTLIPAILSLMTGRLKFYDYVPVVSVIQIQDFLIQLSAHADELKHFTRRSM